MFDPNIEFADRIRQESGEQDVVMRWPTDEEWAERSRGVQINMQRLGRGVTETSVESQGVDGKLYQKIRHNGSPDLQPSEASTVIKRLARCDITGVALAGDAATVEMTVPGGKVSVTLRIPTTSEVADFNRVSTRLLDLPHGRQQLRTNPAAGDSIWKRCFIEAAGYSNGSIPVIHRDAALRAVIDKCESVAEAPKDEDF